jgi:hypothetical protein
VDMGDITASVFLLTPNGCFDDTGGGDILVKDPGEVTNYENKFPSHSGRFMPR